ncbi:hypothetical protein BW723_01730 [Polaribacter reichenbachii]|uniref:DUF4136 domain-containing protein n=1 Tax=Polaribacter reichenbachii TaxID=996801 RepID=A0A1B8TWL1_9FLAO|nr:hypothetical protein BW723_01730 [Polaribacter reichenbachii]AUC18954.1 hypothetical protein BTO17_09730 [Polaribacter reichenbachii]OBY63889.1 hypothetical protein LPB301_13970 [Polaribacter reichenbachii]
MISDYDAEINFNNFKTYNFFEDIGKGLNEFDVKRVVSTLHTELNKKGLAQNDNPDFYINVIANYSEAQNRNTIGIGIGSGNRNGGFGVSGGIPIGGKKLNEEFIIEFVNAKTNEIIWEGVLNSTIKEQRTPEEKESHFTDIINKILDKYPPKG